MLINNYIFASPATPLLGDDFDDNSIDTELWVKQEAGGGSVLEQNNRLELRSPTGVGAAADQHLQTVSAYDFTGKTMEIDIIAYPGGITSPPFPRIEIYNSLDSTDYLRFTWNIGEQRLYYDFANNGTPDGNTFGIYGSNPPERLRIVHRTSDNKFEYWVHNNGSWSQVHTSVVIGWNGGVASVRFMIGLFHNASHANGSPFVVDNFLTDIEL